MSRYVMSDLHGNKKLFDQIMEFLKPEDTIYCLGDVADRGPDGYEIMKQILSDKRFIYIKGNHEDMFSRAIKEYYDFHGGLWGSIQLFYQNGGEPTFSAWQAAGANKSLVEVLDKLPLHMTVVNEQGYTLNLSHAGYCPWGFTHDDDYLWDRYHFNTEWPKDPEYDMDIVIHGHTPMQYMNANPEDGAFFYDNGHRINIDCGTANSNMIVLLNIDTFDEDIFA